MKCCLLIMLVLLILLIPACGGGGEKDVSTPTTSTLTPIATATPTSTEPVKIGVMMPWSGPMAMSGVLTDQITALIEEQVKNMGGILGGREVKFIRGDDRGMVAESAAQAKKLIMEDRVTALTLGGISAAHFTAVADVAEELKVPYVSVATIYNVAAMKYSACTIWHDAFITPLTNFIADYVKPKTVAWLAFSIEDAHYMLDGVEGFPGARDRWKSEGIDVVYEQYYDASTTDFSPYLTKIKYLKPDILVTFNTSVEQEIMIHKQIMEQGGWGGMKYFASIETGSSISVARMPSSVGTYATSCWLSGSDEPGMKAYEDAFKQKYGREPTPELTHLYNPIWTAIKAIQFAGTDDREKVAQALRSGNLEWDSAWGPLHIDSEGKGHVSVQVVQIKEGGELVKVWPN